MDVLIRIWVFLESRGLKVLGYKLYAIGAVMYSFYRLRLWQPIFHRVVFVIHNSIIGLIQ